jgi:hypothetical protein
MMKYICLIGIIIATLAGLVYLLSRVQMKGWLDEFDGTITKYLPKKDGNTEN